MADKLTVEELAEIQARAEKATSWMFGLEGKLKSAEDVPVLLAHISALEAERNEALDQCTELHRQLAEARQGETCFICKALLLELEEPPHCEDCHVTDEDHERWIEEGRPR